MPESNFYAILGALIAAPVRSFVVGGVSASLRGAPGRTLDVDLVHCREPSNLARLLRVLEAPDAIYRIQPEHVCAQRSTI